MEGQSGPSELSVISWVSAFQECPLSGVPLYLCYPKYMYHSCAIAYIYDVIVLDIPLTALREVNSNMICYK